jgi:hypothetical protein
MMSPITSAKKTIEPTTIPAMAPPDKPLFDFEALAEVVGDDDDEVGDEVADTVGTDVGKVMYAVMEGRTTLAHLCSAPEL